MFTIQLLLSFLIGGIFIALQTLIAERVPNKWKGIILTIPSTMALGLLFIGIIKSPQDVVEATTIIPAGLGINYLFVSFFAIFITFFVTFSLLISFMASLAIWALSAFLLLEYPPQTFLISLIYEIPIIIIAYLIITKLSKSSDEHQLKQFPLNFKHIAIRSLIGGLIITTAVFLSKTLGNIWGGLFSVFPAAFSSTFIIYYYFQGKKVIPSVAKSFFFPGIIGFNIYAWIAAITFPVYGIWLGTIMAYLATFAFFWLWTTVKNFDRKRR